MIACCSAVKKRTMSELELSLFRQRSHEALKQKARRGALFLGVAAGYVKTGRDRIEKEPDRRVQDALLTCAWRIRKSSQNGSPRAVRPRRRRAARDRSRSAGYVKTGRDQIEKEPG